MRGLIILGFFFVLLIVLALILVNIMDASPDSTSPASFLPASSSSNSQQASNSTVVDRDGDNVAINEPCTKAPNDCTLRKAIEIANNKEGGNVTITFATHYLIRVLEPLPTLNSPGTTIKALPEQDVHIDGNSTDGSVLRITGNNVKIIGLRIYGAGQNHSNVRITESAHDVVIANNIIGDDDGTPANCGSSPATYGGILVDAAGPIEAGGARAWIYGNVIECHTGMPGDGINIFTDLVIMGKNEQGAMDTAQPNFIRENQGWGINLNRSANNVISNSEISNNGMGAVYMENFNNSWTDNKVR